MYIKSLLLGLTLMAVLIPCESEAKRKRKSSKNAFQWEEVTETDWSAGAEWFAKGHTAVMLFEKVLRDDKRYNDKGKGPVLTFYRRIRISGVDTLVLEQVETTVLDLDYKIVDVQSRTVFRSGESVALSPDSIRTFKTRNYFDDKVKKKTFTLPAVTDDCIIEYVIKYQTETASTPWVVQKDIPLLYGELRWLPYDFMGRWGWSVFYYRSAGYMRQLVKDPSYLWSNLASRLPKRYPLVEDSTELLFDVKNVDPFKAEPFTISDNSLRGQLSYFYDLDRLPIVYWSSQSRFMQKTLVEDICLPGRQVSKLAERISAVSTGEARLDTLYRWMQDSLINTTILDLDKELRRRGSTWSQVHEEKSSATIEEVLEHDYGSNVIICALFRQLLIDMGFDAKLVHVPDRGRTVFDRKLKSWRLYGALVAVFDSNGTVRFYSPGDPFLEPGQLPWYHEGVPALVEGPDGQFITTPYSDKVDHQMIGTHNVIIAKDLSANSQVEIQLTGSMAREARLLLLQAEFDSTVSPLDTISTKYLSNFKWDSLQVLNLAERNQPLRLSGTAQFAAPEPEDATLAIVPNSFMTDYTNPFTADTRTHQIIFETADVQHETAEFSFPPGWSVSSIPSDSTFHNDVGSCSIEFIQTDARLTVIRNFALNHPVWEVEDYGKVQALFQAGEDMSMQAVQLEGVSSELGGQSSAGGQ